MSSRTISYVRGIVSFGLILILLYTMRGNYAASIGALKKADINLLLVAFLVQNINILLNTYRLKILFLGEKIKIKFLNIIELSYIGFFFNNFMPSSIGGDIIKAYYAGKITQKKAESYVSVFMDRVAGLFSFAGLGLLAILLNWRSNVDANIKRAIFIFVLICGVVALSMLNAFVYRSISRLIKLIKLKGLSDKLQKAYDMLHAYRNKRKILFHAMFISFIGQAIYFLSVYLIFRALGANILFSSVFLIMPLVSVIAMLPSLGGLGLREGAIVGLFWPIVGKEISFSVGIIVFFFLFTISIMGGIIYASSPRFKLKEIIEN